MSTDGVEDTLADIDDAIESWELDDAARWNPDGAGDGWDRRWWDAPPRLDDDPERGPLLPLVPDLDDLPRHDPASPWLVLYPARVSVAPVGSDPADVAMWEPLGFRDDVPMTFDAGQWARFTDLVRRPLVHAISGHRGGLVIVDEPFTRAQLATLGDGPVISADLWDACVRPAPPSPRILSCPNWYADTQPVGPLLDAVPVLTPAAVTRWALDRTAATPPPARPVRPPTADQGPSGTGAQRSTYEPARRRTAHRRSTR